MVWPYCTHCYDCTDTRCYRYCERGEEWSLSEILKRKIEIEFYDLIVEPENLSLEEKSQYYITEYRRLIIKGKRTGLVWSTIESLPFTEAIKNGSEERDRHINNYIKSIRNLGIIHDILDETELHNYTPQVYRFRGVIGNFMLVADWTRTGYTTLPDGSVTLEYNHKHFASFDIFMARRHQLSDGTSDLLAYIQDGSYDEQEVDDAQHYWEKHLKNDPLKQQELADMIIAGLPGAQASFGVGATLEKKLDIFRDAVLKYKGMTIDELRRNIVYFLDKITKEAKKARIHLCCHPDDPAYSPFLGTPRAVGDAEGYKFLLDHGCGVNLCFGSLTPNVNNRDVMKVVRELAEYGLAKGMTINEIFPHVHFRPIETEGKNFREGSHASHIEELYQIIYALTYYGWQGVFRPDHAPNPTVLHNLYEQATGNNNVIGGRGYSVPGRAMGVNLLMGLFYAANREIKGYESAIDTLIKTGAIMKEQRKEHLEVIRQAAFERTRNSKPRVILPEACEQSLFY